MFAQNINLVLLFNVYVGARVYMHSFQDLSIRPSISEHPYYWHSQKRRRRRESIAYKERQKEREKKLVDKSMSN